MENKAVWQVEMDVEVEQGNAMVLTESKTLRDHYAFNDAILSKVKVIPEIPHTLEVTIEMAANYYEVPIETLRTTMKRNREEFNDYGEVRLLKGKALIDFKGLVHAEPDLKAAPSLTLISRRGLLRLGMMLTESAVAKSVRHYLINVEEVAPKQLAIWAAQREITRLERRQLTDSIQEFYTGRMHGFEYSTFTNLAYKTIFDTDANGLKQLYEFEKGDSLRDLLSTEDLRKVVKVEKTISTLLLLGKDFTEIKDELTKNRKSVV